MSFIMTNVLFLTEEVMTNQILALAKLTKEASSAKLEGVASFFLPLAIGQQLGIVGTVSSLPWGSGHGAGEGARGKGGDIKW